MRTHQGDDVFVCGCGRQLCVRCNQTTHLSTLFLAKTTSPPYRHVHTCRTPRRPLDMLETPSVENAARLARYSPNKISSAWGAAETPACPVLRLPLSTMREA